MARPPLRLKAPLSETALMDLCAGDEVLFDGPLLAARDQAHKRLVEMANKGQSLPFDPVGQIVYYVGPTPAPPGRVIGSAGPTTSGRMDALTAPLLELGLKGLLGKGRRSAEVKEALLAHKAVYFAAFGGAGAFYGHRVKEARVLAWPELGPEALMLLMVEDFPAVVINDLSGGDLYERGPASWRG